MTETTTTKPAAKRTSKKTREPKAEATAAHATAPVTSMGERIVTRPATKASIVETLLLQGQGASLDDLCQATGWLPHTCRAFLTGLRKKGRILDRSKGEDGTTIYKLVSGDAAGTGAVPETVEAVS